MKSLLLLSVLCLSGCTSSLDKLDKKHDDYIRDLKIQRFEIYMQEITKQIEQRDDILNQMLDMLQHIHDQKPLEKLRVFLI